MARELWHAPDDEHGEISRLRRRISQLEQQQTADRAEYRHACEILSDAVDLLENRLLHAEAALQRAGMLDRRS